MTKPLSISYDDSNKQVVQSGPILPAHAHKKPGRPVTIGASVQLNFRVNADTAKKLAALAADMKTSQSDAFRQIVDYVDKKWNSAE